MQTFGRASVSEARSCLCCIVPQIIGFGNTAIVAVFELAPALPSPTAVWPPWRYSLYCRSADRKPLPISTSAVQGILHAQCDVIVNRDRDLTQTNRQTDNVGIEHSSVGLTHTRPDNYAK